MNLFEVSVGVTTSSALDLAEALGTSPKIWMNFQATWDLDQGDKRENLLV